jgi:hypothetical protein
MAIGLDRIPRFTIDRLTQIETRLCATGTLDRRARLSLGSADIYCGDDLLLNGRIVELQTTPSQPGCGLQAVFETDDPRAHDLLQQGAAYPIFDGYWGERAQLVLDNTRNWKRRTFEPSTGAWNPASRVMRRPEDRTGHPAEVLEPRAWDHEHCAICGTTISQAEGDQHEGFADEHGEWVCVSCFEAHVKPKNLAFPIDE